MKVVKKNQQSYKQNIFSASALTTNIKNNCIFCNNSDHATENCKALSISKMREKFKKEDKCFKCF